MTNKRTGNYESSQGKFLRPTHRVVLRWMGHPGVCGCVEENRQRREQRQKQQQILRLRRRITTKKQNDDN
jgi:hypothetical protein